MTLALKPIVPAAMTDLNTVGSWLNNAAECRLWAGPRISFPLQTAQLAAEMMFCPDNAYCLQWNGELAGFGQLIKINEDCYHLARIITNPLYRGQGVARELCSQLITLAWQRGGSQLSLNVYRNNTGALALYQRLGFVAQTDQSDSDLVYMLLENEDTKMADTGKINYLEMPARDLTQTKAFFNTVFGWEFIDYGQEYMAIANAGLDGGFFKSDKVATTSNGSVLIVLYSHELEVTLDKVTAAGGQIVQDIFAFPGGRRFHFADPNGNEYAVWSEVAE
jgi:uncharacterized protein